MTSLLPLQKLDEIEAEMKRIGFWDENPPSFQWSWDLTFELWLQLVYLPNARRAIKAGILQADSRPVGPMARKQYYENSTVPEAHGLTRLLQEFDDLILKHKKGMMRTLEIKPFENTVHRGEVVELWESVLDCGAWYPGFDIEKKVEVNDQLFFVAIVDDRVVGTIMAGYDGYRGWIYSLVVAPVWRRLGIGSKLVASSECALTSKGCVKINLQIMEGNEGVSAFYSSIGYSIEKKVSMGKMIWRNIPNP